MPASVFDLARFLVGTGILLHAARSDVRTRRVADWCWWAFLGIGLVLLEAQLLAAGESFPFLLTPFYVTVFFFSLWYEGEVLGDTVKRRHSMAVGVLLNAGAVLVLAGQVLAGPLDPFRMDGLRHLQLLLIPVMMLLAYMLYRGQLLSGGADAKAFLSIAVLVPFFPSPFIDLLHAPALFQLICPFVLAVFFTGAFFTLFNPLGLVIFNLARGDRGRLMAFAYKVPVAEARARKFVWLSECVQDGRRKLLFFRFRGYTNRWKREQLELLERRGETRVWVQPQIPLMVQLCAGFIFTFVLGNIILYGIVRLFAGV